MVTVRPATAEAVEPRRGLLMTRDPGESPVFYRRGGRCPRVILNGGLGIYSDGNPWFDIFRDDPRAT